MIEKQSVDQKIYDNERLSKEEALTLFQWPLLELGAAADFRRKQALNSDTVGFIIDRIVNYTNVCQAMCDFCAYHAKGGKIDAYELSLDEIISKVKELVDGGGSQVMLQGGLSTHYSLDRIVEMVRAVKKEFPSIYLHSFSPAEVVFYAKQEAVALDDVVKALKDAGVESIPGASDLLVDDIRQKVSPNKLKVSQWKEVMKVLKENGMTSTATMTYGMGETEEQRIEHLDVVRTVQDETGILRAFIPWSFSPQNTALDDVIQATGIDYLKIVSIARIYLDNITYIQAGWLTEGLKLAQTALAMGANDMGGVLTEELVVQATGIGTRTSMEELIDIIKNAGREPVLRNSRYETMRKY